MLCLMSPDPTETLDAFYRATETDDADQQRRLLRDDAFIMTPTAAGICDSADAAVADLGALTDAVSARGLALRLDVTRRVVGMSPSGRAAWVFDDVQCTAPLRVTALLAHDEDWRIAAAYWSVPYATQDAQDAVKYAGRLEPGVELEDAVTAAAAPLAAALATALHNPTGLPVLYSTAETHVTIGSVTDEVFLGPAGHDAWAEFVQFVHVFKLRGPMRGDVVAEDAGWLAANIDIGEPPTPYRFFYVWTLEPDGWRIVVSHDAVARHPLAEDGSMSG
jgi:hypothetical protein